MVLEAVGPPGDGAWFRPKRPGPARPAGGARDPVRRDRDNASGRNSAQRGQPEQFGKEIFARQFHPYR